MIRATFTLFLLIASLSQAEAQVIEKTHEIPLAGNAFEIGTNRGRTSVGRQTVMLSPRTRNKTNVYFRVQSAGDLHIKIKGKGKGEINANFLGKSSDVNFSSVEYELADIGTFNVKDAGYVYVELSAIQGEVEISDLVVTGSATNHGLLYCYKPDDYYWSRRGPSCHLGFTIPTDQDVSYYYNEVLVPVGEDVIGTYFMANGFAQGYFGIQVNSDTERRILFSVWSPFQTDDPKSIPEDQKISLLKKGTDVQVGEFGNEGSGGQSFLRYNWKAGQTYKFLLKGMPDGSGNTDYTAWFFMPEENNWKLIASFKRPKTDTYLKGFHSFLENFNPNQGYLEREVQFKNQWVFDGHWKAVQSAKFSVDNTYSSNQRIDAFGGNTPNGYFLKMGGFFNEIVKPGELFTHKIQNAAPKIDLEKLP